MPRGAVVRVAGGGAYGRKPRPAVIVQADAFELSRSVTLCPMTTFDAEVSLIRLPVAPDEGNGLDRPSWIMVDKIFTLPRTRLGGQIGWLSGEHMRTLSDALMAFLGLAERRT